LPDGLTGGYIRLAKRLGIDGHFHELRHFAARAAICSGADVRTVAGRLGHADPTTTLGIYAHAIEARDREVASVLGATVLGAVNGLAQADQPHSPTPPKTDRAGYLAFPGGFVGC
jgi:hypothetical protein